MRIREKKKLEKKMLSLIIKIYVNELIFKIFYELLENCFPFWKR